MDPSSTSGSRTVACFKSRPHSFMRYRSYWPYATNLPDEAAVLTVENKPTLHASPICKSVAPYLNRGGLPHPVKFGTCLVPGRSITDTSPGLDNSQVVEQVVGWKLHPSIKFTWSRFCAAPHLALLPLWVRPTILTKQASALRFRSPRE